MARSKLHRKAQRLLALVAASALAWACAGRSSDPEPGLEAPAPASAGAGGGGAGGGPSNTPPDGTGAAASTAPYCSPIGVPMVSSATYRGATRPVADAGVPIPDGGASDAGFDSGAEATGIAPDARVEVNVQMSFPWGEPFAIGSIRPVTEGVSVLEDAGGRSFTLSIPAGATLVRVVFRYVCGAQDEDLEVEIALHPSGVQARVVGYAPPF
jgi:hypothetical protein